MQIVAVFFLLGTLCIQLFNTLPSLLWIIFLVFGSILLSFWLKSLQAKPFALRVKPALNGLIAFSVGLLYASFVAQSQLDKQIPKSWEGKDILVSGKVEDIPNSRDDGIRFRFTIKTATLIENNQNIALSGTVRLGWYQSPKKVKASETWQLRIRLKRPSGFMNPGGFDYEKWLFTERIIATGYVRDKRKNAQYDDNSRLEKASWWSLNHIREGIHNDIINSVENQASAAVLSALVVAVRTKLDDSQWKTLQLTGTSHLVAISGLHISVVAGFALLPIILLLRFFPTLNETMPRKIVAGALGILFATVYAMLAGFTLPTQRALIIVTIGVIGLVGRKHYSSTVILSGALLGVLLLDPLAGMTISFWLSFLAVSLILIFLNRRVVQARFSVIKLQLILSLGMLPLTLFFFGTVSLTSPIANLFAIPWVSLIVVPMSLLGMLTSTFSATVSGGFYNIAALAIDWLFKGLNWLSDLSLTNITLAEIPDVYLIIMFLGLLYFLLPKSYPAKWLGLLVLLPVIFFTAEKPKQGEFNYTLLDVGQGMASVLQTENHTLVYDTGSFISQSFDIGKLVLVPYLNAKGIKSVNRLVISHEDIDHRGGAQYLIDTIKVDKVISSDQTILDNTTIDRCVAGEQWEWDGVVFEFLSPLSDFEGKDNNLSCVLRVSNQYHSILITGDIEKRIEKKLLTSHRKIDINVEVLTVPHHGSKTSSSEDFIKAVSPKLALIPAGYRNRFGHPKDDVLERYRKHGVQLLNTVSSGAINVLFPASSDKIRVNQYRVENKGFWSRQ